jgi:hypothetical protein
MAEKATDRRPRDGEARSSTETGAILFHAAL